MMSHFSSPIIASLLIICSLKVSAHHGTTVLPLELAGCWQADQGDTVAWEMWQVTGPHRMLGLSWETAKDAATADTHGPFEFLRIEVNPDGDLTYLAQPGGKPPVAFVQPRTSEEETSGGGWTFDNPDHDFPQRIHYRHDGEQLEVWISDLEQRQRIDFSKTAAPCP